MNYTIEGAPMPVVICNLEGGETMLTEKGAMSWMSPNMKMETTTGGGIGKMFGRAFSGESMFHQGRRLSPRKVHFSHRPLVWKCLFFSKNALPAVSSVEKDLSCSVCLETAPSFSNLTDTSKNMNLHRDNRLSSIPDTSQQ